MKLSLLLQFIDIEQKKNFTEALVFYAIYLLISFFLMGLLILFGIILGNLTYNEAFEFMYFISRIVSPMGMVLISTYICYKKNILDRISVILLILLSAFASLYLVTIFGLLIPAYLTTK